MSRTWRTVVVDDAAVVRAVIRHLLASDDLFTWIAEATNGEEGLRIVLDTAPDLVLLDLAMPVMDGLEFLEAFDGRLAATTVVVLSGFPRETAAGLPGLAWTSGYIQKNDLVSDLLPALREILVGGAA